MERTKKRPFAQDTPPSSDYRQSTQNKRPKTAYNRDFDEMQDFESERASADEAPIDGAFYDNVNRIASPPTQPDPRQTKTVARSSTPSSWTSFDSQSTASEQEDGTKETTAEVMRSQAVARVAREISPELGSSFVASSQDQAQPCEIMVLIKEMSKNMGKDTWASSPEWERYVLFPFANAFAFRTPNCDALVKHARRLATILCQIDSKEPRNTQLRAFNLQAKAIWKEITTIQIKSKELCASLRLIQERNGATRPEAREAMEKMRQQLIPALVFAIRKIFGVAWDGADGWTQEAGVTAMFQLSSELFEMASVMNPGNDISVSEEAEILLFMQQTSKVAKWAEQRCRAPEERADTPRTVLGAN